MKKLILIMYSVFIFSFLDGISLNSIFAGYTTLIIFYAIFLALLGISELRKNKLRVVMSISTVNYIAIVTLYFLELLRLGEEQLVCVRIIAFLTIAFANAYYACKYNLLNKFVVIFYMIAFGFVFSQFIEAGLPFEAYKNISTVFEQQRFRVEFGFYHINAAGNLGACMLILSGYIIKEIVMNMNKRIKKRFALALMVLMDFFVLSYLLATGSRTAILSVILFCVIYIYYRFTTSKTLRGGERLCLRFAVATIMLFVIIDSLGETAVSFFVSSNRLRNFVKTLPVLDTPFRIMFGLGVKSPGSFSIYDAIDNYYLYVLLTMGVVGLIVIGICLFMIGYNLHKLIFKRKGSVYVIIFAIFVCHMISGLSENCILYYIFPSCMIYFTMYFCLLRGRTSNLTELNN